MDRERAKDEVKSRLEDYLRGKGINTRQNFKCLSGTHTDKTPSMSYVESDSHGNRYYCYCHSCGAKYDIFDLIGMDYSLSDPKAIFDKAYSMYGIAIDSHSRTTAREDFSPMNTYTQPPTQDSIHTTDYTDFFLQAHSHIEETDYHRGLTRSTLDRFNVGFVESWRHPKAPKMEPSPRLIIPTSPYSYLARHASTKDFINYKGEVENKKKVGSLHFLNIEALQTATQPIYIVEGELDALSIIDVGGEAIALGTTSKVKAFLELLQTQRPAQPLVIALDNDGAGTKANNQLADGLQGLNIPFYRHNPAGEHKDANEALQADREAFRRAVEEAGNMEAEELEAERETLKREAVAYSLPSFLKDIEDSKTAGAISTGFTKMDEALDGGLYAGLYILGAISSLGKTTFALQIADQIAQAGHDVLVFSLEMARNELVAKSISRITFIMERDRATARGETLTTGLGTNAKTTRGILAGKRYAGYGKEERELIQTAVASYADYAKNIYITEGIGNVGVAQIREKVEKHIRVTGKAPVVVVDYLQIIATPDPHLSDKQATDKNVLELKRLSRDYSIPIIGISSFNRDNYTAPVNMASYKESGAIEYSSDCLIGLQYAEMDYQEGEADKAREKRIRELFKKNEKAGADGKAQRIQIKILKQRNAQKASVMLDFYPMFNYFTAPADGGEEWEPVDSHSSSRKPKRAKRSYEDDTDELPL